jgi:hypothetical protein
MMPSALFPALTLEPELIYTVRTSHPLDPTAGSPWGARQYWQVSEATLKGRRIDAELAAAGLDWMGIGTDGYWRPDVRAQFRTRDGAVVLMRYTGLVEQTPAFEAAAAQDRETRWEEQYMRLSLTFETGAERYQFLNTSLFVAAGRLLGTSHIEYAVFRLA